MKRGRAPDATTIGSRDAARGGGSDRNLRGWRRCLKLLLVYLGLDLGGGGGGGVEGAAEWA